MPRYPRTSTSSRWFRSVLLGAVMCLDGCQTPAARFDEAALARGLAKDDTRAVVLYAKGALTDGAPIHVYLDGDGTPWLRRGRIATDPTARNPLILDLLAADPNPGVLVGRPCYYRPQPDCDPASWTARRYSEEIVRQVAGEIDQTLARYPASAVTLIGYSGGGALAMLVAPLVKRVDTLVTIAANLDTAAWIAHHGYAPLSGSLNPADRPPLPAAIRQYHFFGARDKNVPVALMRHVVERQPGAELRIVRDFDHICCWAVHWAARIAQITDTDR